MTPAAFDFELFPGEFLGPFALGTSLWTILEFLRQQQTAFPQISVSFDNSAPTTSPVLLHVRPYLDLLFSPTQQRLHSISIFHIGDDPPLVLRYNSQVILSPDCSLRRSDVSRIFGPTYAGSTMRYPGLSFSFEEDGQSSFPKKQSLDDRHLLVRRLTLTQYPKSTQATAVDLDLILPCPALERQLEKASFTAGEGGTLQFFPSEGARPQIVSLLLGTTCSQDVLIELGPPLRTHEKVDDRMSIHARRSDSPSELRGCKCSHFFGASAI